MQSRKDYEALEEKILAPFAMKSKDSAGREHDNSQHTIRTCYQRDRDRIVHSEAFRKLEYKTQVFVILEGDYYRTRLTHTIEVAQIARTIGRALRLNEDLIEAIALAHDLGHPPFGHAGEEALNAIMKDEGFSFNHNFRSYEIVTKLENRYPDFPGLDLTSEVLVGILKHETIFDKKGDAPKMRDQGLTLEARVVDKADELAYLSHDIDDGLTSGCITKDDLLESELWGEAYQYVASFIDTADTEMLKYQVVKYLIDAQTKDLLESSQAMLEKNKFKHSNDVKKYHLQADNPPLIDFSATMKSRRKDLQHLLLKKLYRHFRVNRMTEKAKRIIREIFDVYKANPDQLPYSIWPRNDQGDVRSDEMKYTAICNYIAGMTDRAALDEHKKLFNPYQKV